MARARRTLFTLAAVASLSLCLAIVAVGVWGALYTPTYRQLFALHDINLRIFATGDYIGFSGPLNKPQQWTLTILQTGSTSTITTTGPRMFLIPCWEAALVFAILPSIWLVTYFRRTPSNAESLCKKCGYDLRATPDRCPECGNIPRRRTNLK